MQSFRITSFLIKTLLFWLIGIFVFYCFLNASETTASELVKAEARAVIEAQIEAMAIDDWPKAYSYASPDIRKRFGNPQHFKEMVLKGYKLSTSRVLFPSKGLKSLVLLRVLSFI